jgi:hypothetical protein
LCAILILNVIAIVLLSNNLETERAASITPSAPAPPAQQLPPEKPLVRAIILEDKTACPDCFDIRAYASALDGAMNVVTEEGDLAAWNARLVADSRDLPNSKRLPAIAFNATIEQYPQLIENWDTLGYTITFGSGPYQGDWYVLPTLNPPYLDTANGTVHGRVTATYLTKRSCTECYDPHDLRSFLNESRITPSTERTLDADTPAGQELIAAYNITRVPTLLLSADAAQYPGFLPGWTVVGTVERDGTLVLRDLERINLAYYDLSTGRVMKP